MPETPQKTITLRLTRTIVSGLPEGTCIEAYATMRGGEVQWIGVAPQSVVGVWFKPAQVEAALPDFKSCSVLQILHLHRCYFADLVALPAPIAATEIERLDKAAEAGMVAAVNEGLYRKTITA